MKIDGNAIRPGQVLEHKGRLWRVMKANHVQPGKGGAYMQVEMKDLRGGTKANERFRASQTVERARLEERPYQFLYADGGHLTLMDMETFDQIAVERELVGPAAAYLQDGATVMVESHEGEPVAVTPPETVVMEIRHADPVVKGQTASSSYKPAVLENGERIMVPPHIATGERVVVSTADGSYVERAKD